jgi:pimeloyl-ACP methyl ester carboxylesterase
LKSTLSNFSLYIFSGLCADERIFQRIHFPDYVDVHFVKWIKPQKNETMDHYLDRLLIDFDLSKPIVLMGLSFGGVVAQEMSKKIKVERVIIISSLSRPSEMPWYFRFAARIRLHRIAPFGLIRSMSTFARRVFGATTDETKILLAQYSKECDVDLLKWSIQQILSWKGENIRERPYHIHGTNDRLLPLKNKAVNFAIKGGGHFMVYENAELIEIHLRVCLQLITTTSTE